MRRSAIPLMHPKTTDSIKKKHASIRWNPIKLGETVRVRWVFNVFMFFNAEHTQKKTIGRRRRKRPTNETPLFTGTPAPAPTAHFHDGQNGRRRSLIGRRRAWVAWTAPPSHWAKNCRADAVLPSFTEFYRVWWNAGEFRMEESNAKVGVLNLQVVATA